jgi:EF hand
MEPVQFRGVRAMREWSMRLSVFDRGGTMKALIILASVLLPVASAGAADDRSNPDQQSPASVDATFKSLDRNRDQGVSRIEAKEDRAISAAFDKADVNADGYISKPEYVAFVQRSSGAPDTEP